MWTVNQIFWLKKNLEEAIRQVAAAKNVGYDVQWLVSDEKAVAQLTELFKKNSIEVQVIYYAE